MPSQNNHDEELEVDLAGAGERIGAVLLNNVFTGLATTPWLIGMAANLRNLPSTNANWSEDAFINAFFSVFFTDDALVGIGIFLIYSIIHMIYMGKTGQSFGKKLLNLKVIKEDGSDAGFIGVVLLREIVFNIAVIIAMGILGSLFALALGESAGTEIMGNLIGYVPTVICTVMLFAAKDRRTLQDMLAGTVVIKLPRQKK